MTTMLWTLIAIQIAMAAFDTIYHHELTERLAWRPSQRHELALHAARSAIYAVVFVVLGFIEMMERFYTQMLSVPKPQIATAIRLGAKVLNFLPSGRKKQA